MVVSEFRISCWDVVSKLKVLLIGSNHESKISLISGMINTCFFITNLDPASGIISLSGSALDHESIEHYILTVSASDSGNPVLTATATVYVNVKDINDNPPIIEKSLYEVNIAEDLPIGKTTTDNQFLSTVG